jgi:multimeric flavodoxin WrbA
VQVFDLAQMAFPILRTQTDFLSDVPASPDVEAFQAAIQDSAHLAIFFPLWMGGMPALLKALFEQTCRGDFAFDETRSPFARKLKGRSLRVVVTMGMPMLAFRLYFLAHGLKVLERNISWVSSGSGRSATRSSAQSIPWGRPAGRAGWSGCARWAWTGREPRLPFQRLCGDLEAVARQAGYGQDSLQLRPHQGLA